MPLRNKIILISVCSVFSTLAAAQSAGNVPLPVYTATSLLYDFPQSFGASVAMTLPLSSRTIFIIKRDKQKQRQRELITTSQVGFYRYPYSNTGLLLQQSVGFRYIHKNGYFFDCLLSAGVVRTFYDGVVYQVNAEGAVSTLKNFGRYYAINGLCTGFGVDFQKSKARLPLTLSLQPEMWIQYPYNNFILPHLSAQIFIQYHFASFNKIVHQKSVKRGFR